MDFFPVYLPLSNVQFVRITYIFPLLRAHDLLARQSLIAQHDTFVFTYNFFAMNHEAHFIIINCTYIYKYNAMNAFKKKKKKIEKIKI